jgi:hypothetical protein
MLCPQKHPNCDARDAHKTGRTVVSFTPACFHRVSVKRVSSQIPHITLLPASNHEQTTLKCPVDHGFKQIQHHSCLHLVQVICLHPSSLVTRYAHRFPGHGFELAFTSVSPSSSSLLLLALSSSAARIFASSSSCRRFLAASSRFRSSSRPSSSAMRRRTSSSSAASVLRRSSAAAGLSNS